MNPSAIQYLKRNEIDDVKWDKCIASADNGLIYGYSWYLDHMAAHWDALVLNNYEAVMPLTWKKKWGFHYLYQPWFTPCLGLFSSESLNDITPFVQKIPRRFSYCDIDINENNLWKESGIVPPATVYNRLNLLLNLNESTASLPGRYSRLAKRSIKKSSAHQLKIVKDEPPSEIIALYQENYHEQHPKIRNRDYQALLRCCNTAAEKNHLSTYTARTPDGEPVAFYIVLYDDRAVYSLVGGSTEKGKSMGAFYLLTDAAIRDHAGSNKTFRFEGSDNPGIAFFNRQFGSSPVDYQHIRMNRLPFPFNLLKK
ncbi:MAG TPA: GNAT family N-acetyltransferase [Agriterribacter sp.]|nr:GNAT family N-acetyltransferase [Agriterribacter sp.]